LQLLKLSPIIALLDIFKTCTKSIILVFNVVTVVMVLNTTFDNISVILWQSVLLVEEAGVPGENYRPATSH